jgi:hypothetical protein
MKSHHAYSIRDEELRVARDTILFEGDRLRWQEIERQVERLGFGNCYIVSEVRGNEGRRARNSLKPG